MEQQWQRQTDNIIQVKVPVPFSLKWVNSYLILEQSGYTIIDPGLRIEESITVWEQVLLELQLVWEQCVQIIITHQHPDHFGLAGFVQQRSGAPVYMTEEAHQYTLNLWGDDKGNYEHNMSELLHKHNVPVNVIQAILHNLQEFQSRVEPFPNVTYIKAGNHIEIGKDIWEIIETKGHAYGQVMFYDPKQQILICADQVLPRITPHVGVIPGEDRDVLHEFIMNLRQLAVLEVKLALPGHREPFEYFSKRAYEIIAHHERRLERIEQHVIEHHEIDAFSCCEWVFGTHLRLNAHNMRFALTEIIAHLEELVRQGRINSMWKDDRIIYTSVLSITNPIE